MNIFSKDGWLVPMAIVVMLSVISVVLCQYNEDVLYRIQELNLFLYTPLFFSQQLVVPGGLLSWLGAYFTQYFYHPSLGVLFMALWWAVLMFVMGRAFRVPAKWSLVLLVPVVLLLVGNVDMGYFIYYIKLRGYFFVPTIGLTVAAALVWGYASLPGRWFLRTAYVVVTGIFVYPLFGAYGLFALLLIAITAWRQREYSVHLRFADTVVALVAMVVMPVVCYYAVYHQINISYIYFAALPVFAQGDIYCEYYYPYIALAVVVLLLAVMNGVWQRLEGRGKPWAWLLVQAVVLVAVVLMVDKGWYRNHAFRIEARMNRCIGNQDWDGVLEAYRTLPENEEATRMMWMFKNIALIHKGTILEDMYMYRNGNAKYDSPLTVNMAQVGGKTVYLNYGQANYCIRWCMEDGIEYGWKNEHYVCLTYCSLANGEYSAAQKYIDILKQTKYYRDFALKCEKLVGRPDLCRKDPTLSLMFHLRPPKDAIASDRSVIEEFLYYAFPPEMSKDPLYLQVSMSNALQLKDIPTFWRCYHYFAPTISKDDHMPTLVQQAIMMFGSLEHEFDISRMPFDKGIRETYNEMMDRAKQYAGMTEEQMKPLMYPLYGSTYYFDYFFFRQTTEMSKNP